MFYLRKEVPTSKLESVQLNRKSKAKFLQKDDNLANTCSAGPNLDNKVFKAFAGVVYGSPVKKYKFKHSTSVSLRFCFVCDLNSFTNCFACSSVGAAPPFCISVINNKTTREVLPRPSLSFCFQGSKQHEFT